MKEPLKCKFCGSDMTLDDTDFNFPGNHDDYWFCPKCEASCLQAIRFNRPFKEYWISGDGEQHDIIVKL